MRLLVGNVAASLLRWERWRNAGVLNRYYATPSTLVESQTSTMQPFSSLRLESNMPTWIKPLDPHDFPHMDKFILNIWNSGRTQVELENLYDLNIAQDNHGFFVQCLQNKNALVDGEKSPLFCDILLPMNAEITAIMQDDVEMNKLEASLLRITMEMGNCRLHNIRCTAVDIVSKCGDVASYKGLLGDLSLEMHNGNFRAARLQGQDVKIVSHRGNVHIETIYAISSSILSSDGNVTVGTSHGDTRVTQENGSLTVGSLDGDLTARINSGDANVHIMRHHNIDLKVNRGNINLTTDQPNSSRVNFTAKEVQISEEMALQNETRQTENGIVNVKGDIRSPSDAVITCSAVHGKVDLSFKDWMSTLKFST